MPPMDLGGGRGRGGGRGQVGNKGQGRAIERSNSSDGIKGWVALEMKPGNQMMAIQAVCSRGYAYVRIHGVEGMVAPLSCR